MRSLWVDKQRQKPEVIRQGTNWTPKIRLGGESLKTVDKFVYLGSTITWTLPLDEELTSRTGKATATIKKIFFLKTLRRAWENDKLRIKT